MNKFIMLCGLPASGKSTHAQKLAKEYDGVIHASDKLREELYGDENTQCDNVVLFQELHKRIISDLTNGKNVIMDATNISYKKRKAFLNKIKGLDCEKICYVMAVPYEQCLKNNSQRDRKVPEEVIRNMYLNFNVPFWFEGWSDIHFEYDDKYDGDRVALFEDLNNIPQDNPNHTKTIGEHCMVCCENVLKGMIDLNPNLLFAAGLHDIGKKFTKSFVNSKGEVTSVAHYFNHPNVSAYNAMFYLDMLIDKKDVLTTIAYIQWHMLPFHLETEKAKRKYIKLFGQQFYDDLLILNTADKAAR